MIMAPMEEPEILESIKSCADDRAPWPDGFFMAFFSQCWDTIKSDLVAAVRIFRRKKFLKEAPMLHLAIFPKMVGAMEITDFRSINLILVVYKNIAKLLAERLKKVISFSNGQTIDGLNKRKASHGCSIYNK